MLPEDKTPKEKRTKSKKDKTPTQMASGGSGRGTGRPGTRSDPLVRPSADADGETHEMAPRSQPFSNRDLAGPGTKTRRSNGQNDRSHDHLNKQGEAMENITTHMSTMTEELKKTGETVEDPATAEAREAREIAKRMRIQPPIFRGKRGERPEAHLRARDWMDAIGVSKEEDKVNYFRLTLDHLAR